mmetsp:Transcript_3712/g.4321  ORF Transcript_3712/g.4321 Transcript_3712/m.4321 type:complete len:159 (-) Transcript_3712:8-484(-)
MGCIFSKDKVDKNEIKIEKIEENKAVKKVGVLKVEQRSTINLPMNNLYRKQIAEILCKKNVTKLSVYAKKTVPICDIARAQGNKHKCKDSCIDHITEDECIVCLENPTDSYVTNCCNILLCKKCSEKVKDCPFRCQKLKNWLKDHSLMNEFLMKKFNF